MSNPFDYVKAIMEKGENLVVDEQTEKEYVPFLTNRALSMHTDTLFHSQEMNLNSHIDNKLQNDYFLSTIRPIKRKFVPWAKKKESKDLENIKEYFQFNDQKAKIALVILSKDQLVEIRKRIKPQE